jgi:hypothetical protein
MTRVHTTRSIYYKDALPFCYSANEGTLLDLKLAKRSVPGLKKEIAGDDLDGVLGQQRKLSSFATNIWATLHK